MAHCLWWDRSETGALAPCSYLLLPLLGVVHTALQVLQQVEHLLDLSLGVSHILHHALQLHHTPIRPFLESVASNTKSHS